MEIRRVAAASTYISFPMISLGGLTLSGLTVAGSWGSWSDTVGLTSAGNPGFRTLTGAFTESAATGVYGGFLASTELPAASPYVMTRFTATNAATQYLLINTASTFANVLAITAGAITTASFVAGAINAAAIAADAIGASELAADAVDEIVDAVWDEVILGDHSVDNTAGKMAGRLYFATQYLDAAISTRSAPATGQLVNSVDTGAIVAGSFAAGAIDASAIAANAIGASELATDAVAEIADQVWDEVIYGTHNADNTAGKVMFRLYHATDFLVASVLSGSTYADDFLGRTIDRSGSGGRTISQALMALRNKVSISAGTLTVTGNNDTTTEWTATIATQAVTAIVTSIDPT